MTIPKTKTFPFVLEVRDFGRVIAAALILQKIEICKCMKLSNKKDPHSFVNLVHVQFSLRIFIYILANQIISS